MMLRNLANEIGFSLRQEYFSKLALRASIPKVSFTTNRSQQENQYYKLILSTGFGLPLSEIRQVIDVGCRNWSYLQSLSDFFPNSALKGIEVDAGRHYWNLYRRIDMIRAYGQLMRRMRSQEISWLHSDFRALSHIQPNASAAFCFFFPFVSEHPCLKWGLPRRFVCFKELLTHSIKLSETARSPTIWISSHQGEWEAEIARKIYEKLSSQYGLAIREHTLGVERFKNFWPSQYETKVFTAIRN